MKGNLDNSKKLHLGNIDMNLLRVFDAVYKTRNVSRAAEDIGLSQSATSQALTRLRTVLKDALFIRTHGGVEPTPKAQRLAQAVRLAIRTLEDSLLEMEEFDALKSRRIFRFRLMDTGEALFLPPLITALSNAAPGVRLQSFSMPQKEVAAALDSGHIDFAIGVLPDVSGTRHQVLTRDRHVLLVRDGHPLFKDSIVKPFDIRSLEFVAARPHANTMRIMRTLGIDGRLRIIASNFLALPAIVRASDLGVIIPQPVAQTFFFLQGGYQCIELEALRSEVEVSLHWSRRFELDPAHQWMKSMLINVLGNEESLAES